MAINIAAEEVVSFAEATRRLPCRPNGKRIHVAALYRWAAEGLRGIRLEVAVLGGHKFTSMEALQRFTDALTEAHEQAADSRSPRDKKNAREVEIRQSEQAVLDKLGS